MSRTASSSFFAPIISAGPISCSKASNDCWSFKEWSLRRGRSRRTFRPVERITWPISFVRSSHFSLPAASRTSSRPVKMLVLRTSVSSVTAAWKSATSRSLTMVYEVTGNGAVRRKCGSNRAVSRSSSWRMRCLSILRKKDFQVPTSNLFFLGSMSRSICCEMRNNVAKMKPRSAMSDLIGHRTVNVVAITEPIATATARNAMKFTTTLGLIGAARRMKMLVAMKVWAA
mmetsp:Transcript_719/g.2561  ORF Transcript_719/g.2561 Transcript_719/m.2561 type:complete len:229 (-) Transcript_719:2143-2829(-)